MTVYHSAQGLLMSCLQKNHERARARARVSCGRWGGPCVSYDYIGQRERDTSLDPNLLKKVIIIFFSDRKYLLYLFYFFLILAFPFDE